MELMFQPFKKYADFQGRARRSEYWLWTLFLFIVGMVLTVLRLMTGGPDSTGIGFWLLVVFELAVLIPSLAVGVRRLHDTDKSGWMILLGLIPLIGGIILLVFYCMDGTPGTNRFGADPKGRGAGANPAEVFS
jgi:uncharacterized membrane protein YhaH (DUF805 family)